MHGCAVGHYALLRGDCVSLPTLSVFNESFFPELALDPANPAQFANLNASGSAMANSYFKKG
jgi:hypothetical protein